jgi:alpha-tubulin suppressor-like RCC1 family protein
MHQINSNIILIRLLAYVGLFCLSFWAITAISGTVATGSYHSCAINAAGGVQCWGMNTSGQLGDGTTTNRTTPVAVSGLSSGVVSIAAGGSSTCALTNAGAVLCWGANSSGQLGDGTTTQRATPVPVVGLGNGITQITPGSTHTCAINSTGRAFCWGSNSNGRLGDGSTDHRHTPVVVSGFTSGTTFITAADQHTCAIKEGNAYCWGYNLTGQIGDGTTTQHTTPTIISALGNQATEIAAGTDHTCSRLSTGGVYCWGENQWGQLGIGSFSVPVLTPAQSGISSTIQLVSGERFSCAKQTGNNLKCWGDNQYGQLGDSYIANTTTPVAVVDMAQDVFDYDLGNDHACSQLTDGRIFCWGRNTSGQLGNGTTTESHVPVEVILLMYQTITFPQPSNVLHGTSPFTLTATGGASGNPVIFTSSTVSVCTVTTAGMVTLVAPGNCTINANQAGNTVYAPAAQVSRTFVVLPDSDGDGVTDASDNCPIVANPTQLNTDGDSQGDACDNDDDNDGVADTVEITLGTNPLTVTSWSALPKDSDGDGITDSREVAIGTNPNLADSDGDGLSDDTEIMLYCINASSNDSDGDGVLDGLDTEPGTDAQCTMPMGGLYKGSVIEDGVGLP